MISTVSTTRRVITTDFTIGAGSTFSIAPSKLIYAIGDIHGQLDLLTALMLEIIRDIDTLGQYPADIIYLGDYIDRSIKSKQVIDFIINLKTIHDIDHAMNLHHLCGNHEDMLLKFLDDPSAGPSWVVTGGGDTLLSYGIVAPFGMDLTDEWEEARLKFRAVLPISHLHFYQELKKIVRIGDFAFVHAGVRPNVALDLQVDEDLMWIRRPFLQEKKPFEKIIIHGHTPVQEPQMCTNRVCIDTGAFATGVLTALKLYGDQVEIIQSKRDKKR